jgi:Tfp pilus assembly protein PilF
MPRALRAIALVAALAAAGCSSRSERIQAGLDKAARLVRDGQWDKARLETRSVLQIDPKNAPAHALVAQVAEGLGDYPHAWIAWQQAAELAPDDLDTQAAIARLQLLGGDADAAQRGLARILARRPDHAGARTLQAAVRARGGDIDGALADLRAVLARQPSTSASLLLASLLSQHGDRPGAVRVLEAALAGAPADTALLVAASQLCEAPPADPAFAARALAFHRRAAQAAPQDLGLWRSWAAFHVRRGELAEAEAVLRSAITADPRIDTEAATLALITFLDQQRSSP